MSALNNRPASPSRERTGPKHRQPPSRLAVGLRTALLWVLTWWAAVIIVVAFGVATGMRGPMIAASVAVVAAVLIVLGAVLLVRRAS